MSTSIFNRRWAGALLEALTRHGVQQVCIAPGSRSTPLTLEAAANSKLTCHTHFDERGLGHLALGLAKVSKQPIALIVTSGTAVANLYPALIEASLTGERLVLLTADRPPELINCGANQAIKQVGMFGSHPREVINLPRPTADISAAWLVSTIDDAMARLDQGALHINCPFAEPLYGGDSHAYQAWSQALGDWWQSDFPWLQESSPRTITTQADWPQWRHKRGVIIAGCLGAQEGKQLADWAETLGWPLLADTFSCTGQPLPCADIWLNHPQAKALLAQAEVVIQFGSNLTGKRMLQWQAQCQPQEYWLIDVLTGRLDPAQHKGRRIVADIADWLAIHPAESNQPWADSLHKLATQVQTTVNAELKSNFSEAQLAHRLVELLPLGGQLFLGNSLIVRLIDALAQLPIGYPVYGNRGASGIDGLLSTSAGVLRAGQKPTLAIVGDISALYDLNSLGLLKQSNILSKLNIPMVLIVVNNDGGAIFSLLPTPEAERERFYRMPHGLNFEHAAALFGLDYLCPENWQELSKAVTDRWQQGGVLLLEIQVPHSEGATTLQDLIKRIETL